MKAPLRLLTEAGRLTYDAARACIAAGVVSQGAALSYYTIFAIAPLFVIALAVAGLCFGEAAAQKELFGQLDQLLGREGGEAIQSLVAAANKSRAGIFATGVACVTLGLASTAVFVQLQDSLNKLWGVRQTSGMGLRNFIRHRLLSFAMVFGTGFLLLVSLLCNACLSALGTFIGDHISGTAAVLRVLNFVISLGIITALFTMIFKFLPDVRIGWRDAWLGGFITALLFNFGKYVIGLYIGRSTLSSVYGAVGSLVILLVWVYYSAQILFFGAQFTCLYGYRFGRQPQPLPGAEFVAADANGDQRGVSAEKRMRGGERKV